MATQLLFPTLVYAARLRDWRAVNARLLRECRQLRADDVAGRRWSARNYPGGYTSYGSAHRMQERSPTFAALGRALRQHVAAFTRALQLDMSGRELTMTDCWVNIMGRGAAHGLHLHPLSTVSGTYYVAAPAGAPGLKFEDPRLERFMAAPPRRRVRTAQQPDLGRAAGAQRRGVAVRELAAPRSRAARRRRRAYQHQFQLQLVLAVAHRRQGPAPQVNFGRHGALQKVKRRNVVFEPTCYQQISSGPVQAGPRKVSQGDHVHA